jgi:CTP synthase (UTP-ammonia lyase)
MTLDGHIIEPLEHGGCYVTTDGTRTFHADQEAAVRHVQRMALERIQYEARRLKLVGG